MSNQIKCLMVAPTDPVTRKLRRGPYMRVRNPPQGVSYVVRTDRLVYPKQIAYYGWSPLRIGLNIFRLFAENLVPFRKSNCSLVHSFFWNLEKFSIPWIHEDDQSIRKLTRDYLHTNIFFMKKATEIFVRNLNSQTCRQVLVWSEWAKGGYVEDGVERSKIRVIPPPFPIINDRRPHENLNILFIGRDYFRKGGDIVLDLFDQLHDFENARLLYVGRVDDKRGLKTMRGNKKRIIHFTNPPDEVLFQEIFPVSDIFVLPTRADAFAISVVEAMSRGIPIVTSNISALPEIVQDGVSGFLAKPNDTVSFSKYTARLLENAQRRRKVGNEAQKRVARLFSSKKIGKALKEVYAEAT